MLKCEYSTDTWEETPLGEIHQKQEWEHEYMCITATIKDIQRWADNRNLIKGSTAKDQICKLVQEVGELSDAVCKGNRGNIQDELGDCIVVLKILAAQNGLSIHECLNTAYAKIKNRKGTMRDGIFIKEEDL